MQTSEKWVRFLQGAIPVVNISIVLFQMPFLWNADVMFLITSSMQVIIAETEKQHWATLSWLDSSSGFSWQDLKWSIDRSTSLAHPRPTPTPNHLSVYFLSLPCSFPQTFCQIIVWHPHLWGWRSTLQGNPMPATTRGGQSLNLNLLISPQYPCISENVNVLF